MRSNLFAGLQKLGQSLMVPVSVLPAAGLIVALGRFLQSLKEYPEWVGHFGQVLYSGGLAIFEQLPVVFAVGVAIGFSGGAGIAALSAVVGYFTLTSLLKVLGEIQGLTHPINMGVFGGILMGFVAAALYRRFSTTELPRVLGFFSGKRLVSIMVVFATIVISVIFSFVWPPLQAGINQFGEWVMDSSLGGAFYAAGKRLLIPVGLHHVYYQPFLFQFGSFTTETGTLVHGDSARYFAGDPTAGTFMASEFPIMLFGLPAAALAIVLRAPREKRKAIGGVMLSAALTSILTGITEPIEFAFIFVAPVLFAVHVGLAFVSGMLTHQFDVQLGYTFSASLIDFVLGFFNQKNSFYLWVVIGPLMALLYFSTFYGLIGLLNLKTPGRETNDETSATAFAPVSGGGARDELPMAVLTALGGPQNIENLEACITRLRVTVRDGSIVNQNQLKSLGAAGLFHDGKSNFQVVYGTQSDSIKEKILRIMQSGSYEAATASSAVGSTSAVTSRASVAPARTTSNKSGSVDWAVGSPLQGRIIPLEQVPDQTFSQKIMGEGVAIEPTEGLVKAPFTGKVLQVFKTGHAVGLESDDGVEILIHVGIDTVKLKGQGFETLVKAGDIVKKGDPLIRFDLDLIRRQAPSVITPVVVTNSANYKGVRTTPANSVGYTENLLEITNA